MDLGWGGAIDFAKTLIDNGLDFSLFDLVDKKEIKESLNSSVFNIHHEDILGFLKKTKYHYKFIIVSNVFHLIHKNEDVKKIFSLIAAKMKRNATIYIRLQIRDENREMRDQYYSRLEKFHVGLIKEHFKSGTFIYYRNSHEEVVSIKFINYHLLKGSIP